MGDKTKIEWTDASWNPIRAITVFDDAKAEKTGDIGGRIGWHCEHVSEGCRGCYAESMNLRLGTGLPFKPGHRKDLNIFADPKMLRQPLHWKRPRKIFVCSMTDLFADFVPTDAIDQVFAVMALCPQHTFQILTKRPDRMRAYLRGPWQPRIMDDMRAIQDPGPGRGVLLSTCNLVLPNVWAGTSVEDQAAAAERIPQLLETPAHVRFLSCEPLLGPLDLSDWLGVDLIQLQGKPHWTEKTCGVSKLDWIICGGESGRQARPMNRAWPRSLRDQCAAAGVPFHFKQWGEWASHVPVAGGDLGADVRRGRVRIVHPGGETDVEVSQMTNGRSTLPGSHYVERVGKALAGRFLDGVEHDGFPDIQLRCGALAS